MLFLRELCHVECIRRSVCTIMHVPPAITLYCNGARGALLAITERSTSNQGDVGGIVSILHRLKKDAYMCTIHATIRSTGRVKYDVCC
jgi:hypothetical protein